MTSPPHSPILVAKQTLLPPQPKFALDGGSDGEPEPHPATSHSRTQSRTSAATSVDAPPTPRSLTFGTPVNPFSPPASVRSFSSPDHTPLTSPGIYGFHSQQYPFPDINPSSGITSVATSIVDLPHLSSSYYGSRPTTADYPFSGSNSPSSARLRETFTSPPARPLTLFSTTPSSAKVKRARPTSTMLSRDAPLHKPWLESRDPLARIAYLLTYGVMMLGIAAGAVRCYFGWINVPIMKGKLCMVLDENFDSGDNGIFGENGKFFREVDMSGFGNGEFEMTTKSSNNSFVRNGHLYIAPTLTADNIGADAVLDGYVYNITDCTFNITHGLSYTESSTTSPLGIDSTADGHDIAFDASAYYKACSAVSNITAGQIINPVQSARLSTRWSASIKYGRVEVKAKLPTGDWMWPAIWMLPVDNTYGSWPMSGEIDIMEARGNGPKYPKQGTNYVRSSLNWGPTVWLNAVYKTYGWWTAKRSSYDRDFHTYVLEWSEDFMRIYVDTRLHHMLDLRLNVPFFERGDFPPVVQNGSEAIVLKNPWVNGTKAAPFDQPFYLILDVGIGGTNGWFPDGDEKPWLDGSLTAMKDFVKTQDKWYPTWPTNVEDRAMVIDHVKMWQQC